ncbi:MAG: hypothetical protein H6581_28030 [Bacteroidia bacterium]|nr:hypothetical protein [Bacteroidia bacterium]
MKKNYSPLILSLLWFAGIFSPSCTPVDHHPEERANATYPESGINLRGVSFNKISLDYAKQKVFHYGTYVGANFPDLACETPLYWEIRTSEMDSVLANTNGEVAKFRIYLGRTFTGTETTQLILMPIGDGEEDVNNIQNLIMPCPSTCGNASSTLKPSFFAGLDSTIGHSCNY